MYGKEDEEILNYFINTAFPSEQETKKLVEFIGNHDGVKAWQLLSEMNMRKGRIDKAISFLLNDGFIRKEKAEYYITPKK